MVLYGRDIDSVPTARDVQICVTLTLDLPSGAQVVLGRDGGERRASAVAASTVWRRETEERERDFQRPGREAPKPRTKRRGGLLPNEIRDSGGAPRPDLPRSFFC